LVRRKTTVRSIVVVGLVLAVAATALAERGSNRSAAADINYSITPGGPAVDVSMPSSGDRAVLTFTGAAGQRVAIRVTNLSLTPAGSTAAVSLHKPDGIAIASTTATASSGGWIDTLALPVAGTYSIIVDPSGTSTGTATVKLHDVPADITGSISPGGASVSVSIGAAGQDALYTFSGVGGDRVSLHKGAGSVRVVTEPS